MDKKKVILLVEDNAVNQEIAIANLEMLGYLVEIANNGQYAVEAVKRQHYDLILMDLRMPVMNGIEASSLIREHEQVHSLSRTPVIAFSAELSSQIREQCRHAGIDDYLEKPFTYDEMKNTISRWLTISVMDAITDTGLSNNLRQGDDDILDMDIIKSIDNLKSQTGRDVLGNAIKSYRESVLNDCWKMKQALLDSDFDEIAKYAHSLKSSSGMLGVRRMFQYADEIESAIKEMNVSHLSILIDDIAKEYPVVEQALIKLSSKPERNKKTENRAVGNNKHLLIVDGDPVTLGEMSNAMQHFGYTVNTANNGSEALNQLEQKTVDLIITGLQMPVMDGYALSEAVRDLKHNLRIPVILLINEEDEVQMQRAFDAGISHFYIKPVNILNLAYSALFTIQNAESVKALRRNQKLIETVEQTVKLHHWCWSITEECLECSAYLNKILNISTQGKHDLRAYVEQIGGVDAWVAVNKCLNTGLETHWEQELNNKDSKIFILHRFRYLINQDGALLFGTAQDVTLIRKTEQRIFELAYTDSLTSLCTRMSFNAQLNRQIDISARRRDKIALLKIRIDNFTQIKDKYGNKVRDELLVDIVKRMQTQLRKSDTACRSDDELYLMINSIDDEVSTAKFTSRIQRIVAAPVEIAGSTIMVMTSIGIALYPNHGDDVNSLINAADAAMYNAGKTGKNKYEFYDAEMTRATQDQLEQEADIRAALKNQQFELYYQPIISLQSGEMVSVEALIRWNHPEQGLLLPELFIPAAEKMGVISEIGQWLVEKVCQQIKSWNKSGIQNLPVAVNISPQHFVEAGFVESILTLIEHYKITPDLIEIEISEQGERDQAMFTKHCQLLRQRGLSIIIDDFGTGNSSLSKLKDEPADILKVDNEIIKGLLKNTESSVLTGTILGMSRALGFKVVAEGVEQEAQVQILAAMGCDMAQGFFFSPPVPAKSVPKLYQVNFMMLEKDLV